MPPVQTSYTTEHVASVEGAVVDGQLKNIRSKAASVAIPFGRVVTRGAGADVCKLPTTAGEVTAALGISARVQDEVANASDVLQDEIGANVSICDFGVIYMRTEDDIVAANSPVFVRHVAGGGEELGRVRSNADGTDATVLPGAVFDAVGSAGTLIPIRIRLS
jgi:hypothetical protein